MMTEELEQLLKNLKLRRMLEIYDEQLRVADKGRYQLLGVCDATGARAMAGQAGGRERWSGAFSEPICRSIGRWRLSPSLASLA